MDGEIASAKESAHARHREKVAAPEGKGKPVRLKILDFASRARFPRPQAASFFRGTERRYCRGSSSRRQTEQTEQGATQS